MMILLITSLSNRIIVIVCVFLQSAYCLFASTKRQFVAIHRSHIRIPLNRICLTIDDLNARRCPKDDTVLTSSIGKTEEEEAEEEG